MPDLYGPFGTAQWTQSQWYRDAYARAYSGVFGSASDTISGGDLGLSLNGLNWSIGLGRAHVRGAGYERTGTPVTGTVTANTSGNPRIDRLVVRRDLGAQVVSIARLQGTASATPLAPNLTQNEDGIWEIPLFNFTVPPNPGTTLTNVTDERLWIESQVGLGTATVLTPFSDWVREGNGSGAYGLPQVSLMPWGQVVLSGMFRRPNVTTSTALANELIQFTASLPVSLRPGGGQVRHLGVVATSSGPAQLYMRNDYALCYSFWQDTAVYRTNGWFVNLNGATYFK